jgi:uncharacterized oligopeptide transporter (OPT) family protein
LKLTGVFFVIPLRKYYIVHQKLTFPTPAATAYTIRSLHHGKTGAIAARKKSLALLYTFCATFVFKVISGYAPGIVRIVVYICAFTDLMSLRCTTGISAGLSSAWDSPVSFHWTTMVGGLNVCNLCTCNKSFFNDGALYLVTPAFFGAGMLSGLNASWSFCQSILSILAVSIRLTIHLLTVGGSILAWGISAFWSLTQI